MLIDKKIEHHVHAIAIFAEEIEILFRQNVGFTQKNGGAFPPLQERAHIGQIVELAYMFLAGLLRFDDERPYIDSKPGNTELEPVPHNPLDLCPDFGIIGVEIRLKLVKAVEVPLAGDLVV